MASIRNKTISELSQWAADPDKMALFEAVALLCQRTAFVKKWLDLPDHDDVIRMQIQAVCKKHGVDCKMSRGNGYDGLHSREVTSHQRYIFSFLLSTLLSTSHGGIAQTEDGLDSDNLLKRMVYSFRRYLSVAGVSPQESEVSFEMFAVLYVAYTMGQVDLLGCNNCGSSYVNLRVSSNQCPVCTTHRLAQVPGKAFPSHTVVPGERHAAGYPDHKQIPQSA